ncbi:hypothetical protein CLAVI_000497 [Candidatus Clavichlamydia salmonicola]|uniref:hypothetical protein n=1 Tax=Candidatus Clavichlamydia salmonicola TaxID=469812 RepID=UPI001890E42C|nr:hypothetical protein [Candidatus Clavichlamydia salmonicola]MBF5050875.1 hypothetical protein [Candidatus Clavichlamydia salmonicola]
MLQINHILSYVGLRAPSSSTEALYNMKKNTLKLLGITGAIILGAAGLYSDKLCNHCLLCLPASPNTTTPSHVVIRNWCTIGIAPSSIMTIGIIYILGYTSFFSFFKQINSKNYKKICWVVTKSIFLSSIAMGSSSIAMACLFKVSLASNSETKACSLVGFISTLLGGGYILFAFREFLLIIFPKNQLITPPAIELIPIIPQEETEIELTPLRSRRLYPTTQIINTLSQLDSLVSSILEISMTSTPDNGDSEIDLLLQQAILKISFMENILMQNSNLYSPEIFEELDNLASQICRINRPLRGFHNHSTLAIMLSLAHTLTRRFVALHAIEVPANILLSLPQFQSLCPPPKYALMTTSPNHLSRGLTSAPLNLEAPPAYAEYPVPQLSSPETTPIHSRTPSTSDDDEEMLRIFMRESSV